MLFFELIPLEEAFRRIDSITEPLEVERVGLIEAVGRVAAEEIRSPVDLPPFDRSTMDGYAVIAADTFGASPGLPAYLKVVGEVRMGEKPRMRLSRGEAVRISTGGMLPEGADAVVMLEHTELVGDTLEVIKPVSPGENVIRRGDDLRKGDLLIPKGRMIRPQEAAALAGAGVTSVLVHRKPRVAIIPTGDEIVPPDVEPEPGRIRDMNSYSLAGLCLQEGAVPVCYPIVPDDLRELSKALEKALEEADLVLISGGSSVGTRDIALQAIESMPNSRVHVHGISIRPGKPVIIATVGRKLVFGVPGNPVSAIICFILFIRRAMRRMAGLEGEPEGVEVEATLSASCPSFDPGKANFVPVKLEKRSDGYAATPLLGLSAMITTLTRADGLIKIPEGVEGLEEGERVRVMLI
ncbi:molybdopterin molybdenumtransferase MoeA [Candidatus Poribacteria bacterium]|nr:MAG: molybdopterin molybdenumtransferase MoeA [Candidatus Poribacteria bacterium]